MSAERATERATERPLLDYQRGAAEFRMSLVEPVPGPVVEPSEPARGLKAALFRAGWNYQVRLGLRIWSEDKDDWRQAWFGEEVACELVNRRGEEQA